MIVTEKENSGTSLPSIQITSRRRGAEIILAILSILFLLGTGTAPRAQAQTYTVLHNFTGNGGGTDGGSPQSGVVMDSAGNLYGTTYMGGAYDLGVVFKFDTAGNEVIFHTFKGGPSDGGNPYSSLLVDKQGNLYGTVSTGGATGNGGSSGAGAVFKLDSSGSLTILYSFTGGADGATPRSGLVMDGHGNLYGTTFNGGAYGHGVLFKLDSSGNETVIHSFSASGSDGTNSTGDLIMDTAGNIYGTSGGGGAYGYGTIFKVDTSGSYSILYNFLGGANGATPGTLVMDNAGNFYGPVGGGAYGYGAIFKLDNSGNETILHSFNYADGSAPDGQLTLDSAGNIYGTSHSFGPGDWGTVFELDPSGNLTILHAFSYSDGGAPIGALVPDVAGNFYGITEEGGTTGVGTFYKLTLLTPTPTPQPVLQWGLVGTVNGNVVSSNVPLQASMPNAIAVTGGDQYMMALTPDGQVWTWGNNTYGQLGDGTNTDRATPAAVPGLDHVIAIAAGRFFALALKDDHTVWTWGGNRDGQLGDGTTTNRNYPAQVPGLTDVTAIAGGGGYSLALKSDGTVVSWGLDSHGQLGVGYLQAGHSLTPVAIQGISNVAKIDAGFGGTSFAVLGDGSVWAWGDNERGQLGDGTTIDRPTPVSIGITNAVSVASGGDASAAVLSNGNVETWGSNNHAMLGDGTTVNRFTPAIIPGISNVKQIDAGFIHMVTLKQDGTVWVWGSNADYGQLGVGQPAGYGSDVPIQVTAVAGVSFIAAGGTSTMALGTLTSVPDTTPPTVSCASAPPGWHSDNVSVACTATDSGGGLADSADASFTLSTDVAAGVETANASTGTLQVCDSAGNCVTAGPVTGIMVDRKPPAITITAPTGTYTINQSVTADYSCADGGSGVATCTGPVANSAQLDVSSIGAQSFAVTGTDSVGNSATKSNDYTVSYTACILYDPTKAAKSGSTLPIKIQLCDAANQDVSSSGIVVHATSVVQTSSSATYDVQDAGNANPDSDFRFDATLGPTGGYIFNFKTTGLQTGTYAMTFTAGDDPTTHYLYFQVR